MPQERITGSKIDLDLSVGLTNMRVFMVHICFNIGYAIQKASIYTNSTINVDLKKSEP